MNEPQRRFVEDIAHLLIPWGVPSTAARLYGFLLLCDEPVGLDALAEGMEVSKSSASVAARLLEKYLLARRHGERGSKRVLYEASENYEGMLIEQKRMLETLTRLLQAGASEAALPSVRERLEEMAAFYITARDSLEAALAGWRARSKSGRAAVRPGRTPVAHRGSQGVGKRRR